MACHVFISHASEDFALAESVCRGLELAGIRCWLSPRDLIPGVQYAEALIHAISESQLVVLVCTQHACGSPHVSREIERAASKSIPITTYRLTGTSLSPALEYFLSQSHWLEADAGDPEREIPALVAAVSSLIARTGSAPTSGVAGRVKDERDERPTTQDNLLHGMWELLDPNLQDAFSLAYNKKRRERGPGPTRISTRDLFQALARIDDRALQRLLAELPEGAMPEPVDESVRKDDSVLREEPLLSDCIAESLASFRRVGCRDRNVKSLDLFVDIAKHGHGPSVRQLRQHGVDAGKIDEEVQALGVDTLRPR